MEVESRWIRGDENHIYENEAVHVHKDYKTTQDMNQEFLNLYLLAALSTIIVSYRIN